MKGVAVRNPYRTMQLSPMDFEWEIVSREPYELNWTDRLIRTYFDNDKTRAFIRDIRNQHSRHKASYLFETNQDLDESEIAKVKQFLAIYNFKLIKNEYDAIEQWFYRREYKWRVEHVD